jgi:hypothetical protein
LAPTATTIVTEAYKLAGVSSPSAAEITRAEDEWLQLVLEDIASRRDWEILKGTKISIVNAFEQRLSVPVDFENMREIKFYDGTHKDAAQGGSSSSITLAADEDIIESDAKGKQIFITGGTGVRGMARIVSYSESSKIAGIAPNWAINPVNGSTYMIANLERSLDYTQVEDFKIVTANGSTIRVSIYDDELYFDPIPDVATYAVVMRYMSNITQIDTSGTRYSNILTKWRTALTMGVKKFARENEDDKRIVASEKDYEKAIVSLRRQGNRKRWSRHNSFVANRGGMPLSGSWGL